MTRVVVVNTGWGAQVVDCELNEVLYALNDNESPGPHRSERVAQQALELASFYNEHPRPFKVNDLAIVKPGLSFDQPRKVRILKCEPDYGKCESGWVVSVAKVYRGRRPKHPVTWIDGVDSGWFEK